MIDLSWIRCASDCPPGWEMHVQAFLDEVKVHPKCLASIEQIKTKFGGLRIYMDHQMACKQCLELANYYTRHATMCESCGASGAAVRGGYWVQQLCEECCEKRSKGTK